MLQDFVTDPINNISEKIYVHDKIKKEIIESYNEWKEKENSVLINNGYKWSTVKRHITNGNCTPPEGG